jgi:hypothetical protein
MKFLLSFFSLVPFYIFSEIDITTIDSFRIVNAGPHTLLVKKYSENSLSKNGFIFHVKRPHCFADQPSLVMYSPDSENFVEPDEDSIIKAKIRINLKKTKDIDLQVYLVMEERVVLNLKGNFPSLREARVMSLDSIYGRDMWVLEHLDSAIEEAIKICESFVPYEDEEEAVKETKV